MRAAGADGLVVAMNAGNAAGAKGSTSRARGTGQPARGGTDSPSKPLGGPVLRLDEPDEVRISRPVP